MSADNEIAVLRSKDGFRVAEIQASQNLYYEKDFHGFNKEALISYFGEAKFFALEEEAYAHAFAEADKIEENGGFLEYGICSYLLDAEFPKDDSSPVELNHEDLMQAMHSAVFQLGSSNGLGERLEEMTRLLDNLPDGAMVRIKRS